MNKKIAINRKKILVYIIFITFVLTLWAPTTYASTLGTPLLKSVTRILYFVFAIIIAFLTDWKQRFKLTKLLIALTPVVAFMLSRFWVYEGIEGGSVSSALTCVLVALQGEEVQREIYKLIKGFLVIMSVVGIVCYIAYLWNLGLPYNTVPYYSIVRSGQWYIDYGVCYLHRDGFQVRLCGLFNEPGWFGTFLAFILCAEDMNLKKKSNIIMLIAGFLTFSLAYVLILIIFYLLKNFTNWKRWIVLLMIVLFYIFVLPNIETGNSYVDKLISRMVITEEGLSGDNRTTSAFDEGFGEVINSSSIYFGKGNGYSAIVGTGTLSIKTDIVDYGVIGTLIKYVPIIGLLLYQARKEKRIIIYLLCVFASLYQRPWLFEVSNFILLLASMAYLLEQKSIAIFNEQSASQKDLSYMGESSNGISSKD